MNGTKYILIVFGLGGFSGLAEPPPDEPGALDSVSVATYVRLVARKGARVGTFTGGRCQWAAA